MSFRVFKVAKNTLGDNRLRLLPETAEMNLVLKYNLRAINHSIDNLNVAPQEWVAPNDVSDQESDDSEDEQIDRFSDDEDSLIELSDSSGSDSDTD